MTAGQAPLPDHVQVALNQGMAPQGAVLLFRDSGGAKPPFFRGSPAEGRIPVPASNRGSASMLPTMEGLTKLPDLRPGADMAMLCRLPRKKAKGRGRQGHRIRGQQPPLGRNHNPSAQMAPPTLSRETQLRCDSVPQLKCKLGAGFPGSRIGALAQSQGLGPGFPNLVFSSWSILWL